MQELNDERVLFAFARDLEPALTVASGETVRIRTQDCFGNQVQTPEDELDEIDWDRINPATGPVFVEGAVPGGALKVTIENIELDPQTASCTGKDEGVCGDRFDAWSTHLCAIDGDKLVWNDQLSIPLNPMIGVIGVAQDELVMLLSLVADVQVCQMVDPEKTVRFMVPKYVLDALGFAL